MSTTAEISTDRQTIETSLFAMHQRLRAYVFDQSMILDDIISIIESFYKTEKHTHERMQSTLQKSLDHSQTLSYLGPSIIGVKWESAIKDLMTHYSQREASYPLLKQVVLENLRKMKTEKNDEYNRVLLYDEEIIKEMTDVERRTLKTKRSYEEAFERLRQFQNPNKEKKSGIERLQQKILPKNELERLEHSLIDTRNLYILHVRQMNFALKFYFEQFIVDLDKLIVCDLFHQIEKVLDDLVYVEYKRLRETLQYAIHSAVEDGDEQKLRLLPRTSPAYPLQLVTNDITDQIKTDEKHIPSLQAAYQSALNDVRDAEQQFTQALEASAMHAVQNKDSRIDSGKIRCKRMEMRKSIASFMVEHLENIVPNIKTIPSRQSSRLIPSRISFMTPAKTESHVLSSLNPLVDFALPKIITQPDVSTGPKLPCQAVVLYDFQSANDDEMSVRKDEKIFIESKTEHEGWLIARGRERSGLVPSAYVQLICSETGKYVNVTTTPTEIQQTSTELINTATAINNNVSQSVIQEEADYFSDDD